MKHIFTYFYRLFLIIMNRITVDIQVDKRLKKYIESSNGSSLIIPDKGSVFLGLIMQHLSLRPREAISIPENEKITIALTNGKPKKYSFDAKKVITINPMFRNYLNQRGQKAVVSQLNKTYKHAFHMFMEGYTIANDDSNANILNGITEFLLEHQIEFDNVYIGTLRKDWYRYRRKKELKQRNPFIF